MAQLWLAPRPGGLAAGLYSQNGNGTLLLLDERFSFIERHGVGHGAQIRTPSFAVLPEGFAALYAPGEHQVELEIYDARGQPQARQLLAEGLPQIGPLQQTALLWTGAQLVALYPGPASGQYVAQLLNHQGQPTGEAQPLPSCLLGATGVSAAWGDGVLGVAAINEGSDVLSTGVCVTLLDCR